MNQPLVGETPDLEEPKYKIRFTSPHLSAEREVSTAQVQFWQDYQDDFVESLIENGHSIRGSAKCLRADLLTNEYHPQFVQNLMGDSLGPLMEKTLNAL